MTEHAPTDPNASTDTPRPEHPRPQFVRDRWLNLNGPWQFEADPGDSGVERGLVNRPLTSSITVPFCPESELSGIGDTDFLRCVWYRREVDVPAEWKGLRTLLHFQAVDEDATVWCNGEKIYTHRGGQTPFTCDLGDVGGTTVTLVVRARDLHEGTRPRGKQSEQYGNYNCLYTRTTGIWQTVWLEPVPTPALRRPRVTPDLAHGAFHITQPLDKPHGPRGVAGLRYRATLTDGEDTVTTAECDVADLAPMLTLTVPDERRRVWSIDDPHLYGLTLELLDPDGETLDRATSYAGLRSVTIDGRAIRLNGQPVFQRLVLDQGYYPDGIMTAPSDQALIDDIRLSQEAGFNGARLHQKVFEERFLYHADRMGYLCWGEFSDWSRSRGRRPHEEVPGPTYITQWLEAVDRDFNHPCIVGWCPMNEQSNVGRGRIAPLDDVMRGMFLATKAFDPTRPVLDVSGWVHTVRETDLTDTHDYDQDPATLAERHAGVRDGRPVFNTDGGRPAPPTYDGQPFFVSEFGGVWWNPDTAAADASGQNRTESWGYGQRPRTEDEFLSRFEKLCQVLLDDPAMFGYCYTQLTDVFQEENGVYRFDRRTKVDDAGMARIRAAQDRPAAIET